MYFLGKKKYLHKVKLATASICSEQLTSGDEDASCLGNYIEMTQEEDMNSP